MMKKILITSDTHRRDGNLLEVIQNEAPFDMFIHLGDAEGSEDMITSWCKEQNPDCEVYMVLGNNDFFSHLDREKEISIGKYRAFLTHGHFYSVSVGTAARSTRTCSETAARCMIRCSPSGKAASLAACAYPGSGIWSGAGI